MPLAFGYSIVSDFGICGNSVSKACGFTSGLDSIVEFSPIGNRGRRFQDIRSSITRWPSDGDFSPFVVVGHAGDFKVPTGSRENSLGAVIEKLLDRMQTSLESHGWLVDDDYTLADVAMTPYVVRLDHLNLSAMIERRPRVREWLSAVQARGNYVAIDDHMDESYVSLMAEKGAEAWPQVAAMLKAA